MELSWLLKFLSFSIVFIKIARAEEKEDRGQVRSSSGENFKSKLLNMTNQISYGKNGRNNFVNKNGKKNGNLDHYGKAGGNIRHNGGDPAKGTEYAGIQLNSGINSTVINKERTPTMEDSSSKVGKKVTAKSGSNIFEILFEEQGKGKSNDEGQKAVSAQTNTKGPRVLADISNKVTRKATKENNTKKINHQEASQKEEEHL
ncbi:hypothetical protein ACOSQ3_014243 [Xanthoceras sorbifolium]